MINLPVYVFKDFHIFDKKEKAFAETGFNDNQLKKLLWSV